MLCERISQIKSVRQPQDPVEEGDIIGAELGNEMLVVLNPGDAAVQSIRVDVASADVIGRSRALALVATKGALVIGGP